jgi:hypothetical protein
LKKVTGLGTSTETGAKIHSSQERNPDMRFTNTPKPSNGQAFAFELFRYEVLNDIQTFDVVVKPRTLSLAERYLMERGITAETIKAYGLEFDQAPSATRTKERLGFVPKLHKSICEILWIPLFDRSGKIVGHIACPLPRIKGLPKFVCALGSDGAPFIPQGVYGAACGRPLIVTESPIKAIACAQAGFDAIGLNGVWGAGTKNNNEEVVIRADVQGALDWRGRKAYIAFDADCDINADVRHGLIRTFFLLRNSGAEVFHLKWELSQGKGIDDYLVSPAGHPADSLRDLLMAAKPFVETFRPTTVDLSFVHSELFSVKIPDLLRSQLCKQLAGPLGVKVSDLEEIVPPDSEFKSQLQRPYAANYEPWTDPVDAVALFSEIEDRIMSEVVTSAAKRSVCALWVMFSWVHEQMDFSPLLYITGPTKECGKTSLARVIAKMAKRPLSSDSISPAALFRLCELYHPSFILDEVQDISLESDFWLVLKAGHTPDKPAIRCHATTNQPEEFDTFCPKLVSGIGLAGGSQILSRSIIIEMERKGLEKLARPLKPNDPAYIDLRRKLARWAADVGDLSRFSLPEEAGLRLRNVDNWEMLYRVARTVSEDTAKQLLADIKVLTEDSSHIDYEAYLFEALRDFYQEQKQDNEDGFLGSEAIIETLNKNKEGPWYWQKDGLTVHALGKKLGKYKVKSKQVWNKVLDEGVRGYHYKDLEEKVFKKYLLPSHGVRENRESVRNSPPIGSQTGFAGF